ncbi:MULTISPECIES: phage N-6-adenine-methyltransferase [Pasteurellaceae]|uniref:Phage N-6-adenine-methyltransferase n=1 Tax=Pasteurella atlantica TaxID=2827233 RepID=A0AAW8CLI4_9PAST|nr:phage N-6-adenine-methyltransferase [Pasteurella atlantica]MBR0573383.1 phage N-6-adenine-methyltransferase [Pasteurella atlantica]MDP8039809.1 phage N-6-adenine-methyltransferase [Pasteurella atlantica]MDP8041826.1 phage N-6-adenine-methyltransferase [Pasteurella atlantica]MDP8043893.1 phage N-6-adenine-methyltransferase [Pasteurella atlantica]MDP8046104.1 phage N-6-adenine-methyltransferase [Pasteurella atlantica]
MTRQTMDTDSWATPFWVICFAEVYFLNCNILNNKGFGLDAAASEFNRKCKKFISKEENALNVDWTSKSKRIWCNPPYSNPLPFIEKAITESEKGAKVVMLLNVDNSTKWFAKCVQHANKIVFVTESRIPFLHSETGLETKGARRPQMFVFFDKTKREKLSTDYVPLNEIRQIAHYRT